MRVETFTLNSTFLPALYTNLPGGHCLTHVGTEGPADWSATKGAAFEGYVIQVIRSEDSDIRLYLAAKPEETDTRKWVIIEVKPAWMEKLPGLAQAKLWELHGKKVRVTGWLFFDATPIKYPRGTNWEIHPVTEIVPVK